jgi:cytochrome c oxidase subunit 3
VSNALFRAPRGPTPLLSPPRDDPDRAQQLGMRLFLASLTVLFGGVGVAFFAIRSTAPTWPPEGAPAVPESLWLSTALALAVSGAMQWALSAIRAGNARRLARGLGVAWILAAGFCASQVYSGWRFFNAATFAEHLYGFAFYMLTGVHGLHVIGGMIALPIVWWRARAGAYGWSVHAPVRNCTSYWHYLAVVWILLMFVLKLG